MILLAGLGWSAEPSVLDDPGFRFCHEYADFAYNDAFCELAADLDPERCPGLQKYCAAPDEAPASGCNADSIGSGPLGTLPSDAGTDPEPAPWNPFSMSAESMEGAQTLLAWIVAMVVALLLLGVAGLIARFVGFRRAQPGLAVTRQTLELEAQSFAQAVDDVPDLPSDDLLAAAEQASAEGRFGEACVLARGAVLRQLGERRVLRLHRARSDLEYVGQAGVEQRPLLAQVLAMAARHRWGRIPLDARSAQQALDAARRLLLLGLLLIALGPSASAFDRHGPSGDAGLRRLLDQGGATVTYRSTSLASLAPDDPIDLLVLDLSGIAPTEADWEAIEAWVAEGHVLWVSGDPAPLDLFGERIPIDPPWTNLSTLPTPHLLADLGFSGGIPVLTSAAGDHHPIAWEELGDGVVLAFADSSTFWNGFLVEPDNEAFMAGLVKHGVDAGWPLPPEPRVEFSTVSGTGTPPQTALANLKLVPFVLQILLIWLVVVAWKGWPFRKNREDDTLDRTGFREHIDAVADQYRRVGGARHTTIAYAKWVLQVEGREGLQLRARRAGYTPPAAARLLERTTAAAEHGEALEPELEEELWKLMQG